MAAPAVQSNENSKEFQPKAKAPKLSTIPEEVMKEALSSTYYQSVWLLPDPAVTARGTRILWRGCRGDQLLAMARQHSAGGGQADPNTKAPTEADTIGQVGERQSFPEFTSDKRIAQAFGRNNYVAVCEIDLRYLTKGSGTERGYIAYPTAPLRLLCWTVGEKLVIPARQQKGTVGNSRSIGGY